MDTLSGAAAVAIYLFAAWTHIYGHDAQTVPAKGHYLD